MVSIIHYSRSEAQPVKAVTLVFSVAYMYVPARHHPLLLNSFGQDFYGRASSLHRPKGGQAFTVATRYLRVCLDLLDSLVLAFTY